MKKEYLHGAVLKLTREDTPEGIDRIFKQMTECGLNTVVVWPAVFWWEEKKEGYPFNTGRLVLRLAEKHGLKIIMELAGQLSVMEYIPDFKMKPEYHPVDVNGNRIYGQSSFGYLNYFHPEVRELISEHYMAAARAYRDFPALIGYDVFNETMYGSYDEYSMADFRAWLKEKYGTIERLNAVWERTYSDFSDIGYEYWKWMSIMPEADFCIWRRESVARFLKPFCDALRKEDNTHLIIADNIHSQVAPGASYDRPQGDFSLNTVSDVIGMSFYPKQQTGMMKPIYRWEVFDGFAAAAGREGFFVSEMQTHIQAIYNPNSCVLPKELKSWCLEAYAAGARALIYWMWRPFTKGLQTLGRGLVNYQGLPTERLDVAREMSEIFSRYGEIKPIRSTVGVLYHERSDDYSRRITDSYAVDKNFYNKSVYGAYKLLCDINLRPDIITLSEMKNYKLVVISNALSLSEEEADLISDYVRGGGRVIFDGKVGVIDEESMLYEAIPGGSLSDLTGEVYFESDNRENSFTYNGKKYDGYYGRDIFTVKDAQIIAEFYDGRAAAVKKNFGQGTSYTFNLHLFYGYLEKEFKNYKELILALTDSDSLITTRSDMPVHLRSCESEDGYLLFVFNYTEDSVSGRASLTVGNTTYEGQLSLDSGCCEILFFSK